MIEEEVNDFFIDKFLSFVHFHFRCTEVMQQRIPSGLLNDPIGVSPILDEQLSNKQTYFLVLETEALFNESIKYGRQRVVIERVRFVDFGIR